MKNIHRLHINEFSSGKGLNPASFSFEDIIIIQDVINIDIQKKICEQLDIFFKNRDIDIAPITDYGCKVGLRYSKESAKNYKNHSEKSKKTVQDIMGFFYKESLSEILQKKENTKLFNPGQITILKPEDNYIGIIPKKIEQSFNFNNSIYFSLMILEGDTPGYFTIRKNQKIELHLGELMLSFKQQYNYGVSKIKGELDHITFDGCVYIEEDGSYFCFW